MDAQTILMVLVGIIGGVLALSALAYVRKWVVPGLCDLIGIVAMPFAYFLMGLQFIIRGTSELLKHMALFLSTIPQDLEENPEFRVSDLIGPIIYFLFLVVLTAGDALLAVIRFPLIFRSSPPKLDTNQLIGLFTVLWVVNAAALTTAAMDLWGMTHFAKPYMHVPDPLSKWLKISSVSALGFMLLTTILFAVFGALALDYVSSDALQTIVEVMLFVLITLGVAACAFSFLYGPVALLYVVFLLLRLAAFILTIPLGGTVALLDKIAGVLCNLYDIVAGIGRSLWNWLCRLPIGDALRFEPIPEFDDRPHILKHVPLLSLPDGGLGIETAIS